MTVAVARIIFAIVESVLVQGELQPNVHGSFPVDFSMEGRAFQQTGDFPI